MSRTTVAQQMPEKAHNRARSCVLALPPLKPPPISTVVHPERVCTNRGVGTHSAGPAGGGPDERAHSQDWEQAANIAILKAMVHFPGRDPATTWQLARRAAAWMRNVQIKYPEKAVPDYLRKKIFDEYQKLPVIP